MIPDDVCRLKAEIERLKTENDRLHARFSALNIPPQEPDKCEHAVTEGDWCPDCNAEYKRAEAAFKIEENQ